MSLAQIKIDTETYIAANWATTPIFYDTQNIVGDSAIHLSFINIDREIYSSGCANGGRKLDYTAMKIRFYGSNTLEVLEYQDAMNALLECYEFDNTTYDVGKPDGLGSVNLQNGVIESTLNYNAKTYN